MKDMDQTDLQYLLEFIYLGEVAISNDELERLVTISKELGIVGLNNALGGDEGMDDDKRALLRAVKRKSIATKKVKIKKARVDPDPSYDDFQDDHIFLEDYMDGSFECDANIGEGNEDDEESSDEEEPLKRERRQQIANEVIKGEISDNDDEEYDADNTPTEDATFATVMDGNAGKGSVYVIGDYLYNNFGSKERKLLYVRCRKWRNGPIPCRATAKLSRKTLRVVNFTGEHSCVRDPDLRLEILAKKEMKELAETTSDKFKAIRDRVCLKYPTIASRINPESMTKVMSQRRKKAISEVPIPGASLKKKEAPSRVKSEESITEDTINNALIGTVATMMAGSKGDSTLYVIGDYLYIASGSKDRPSLHCRCRNFNGDFIKCTASATVDRLMLTVLKVTGKHLCKADPDIRFV